MVRHDVRSYFCRTHGGFVTVETAHQLAERLRTNAVVDEPDRTLILDAADVLEQLVALHEATLRAREDLESIISNLRAKLVRLTLVDDGE